MRAIAFVMIVTSGVAAQAPLALPDGSPPAAAIPTADGVWLAYGDGSAAMVDLAVQGGIVRTVVVPDPTTFYVEWKDREGKTWRVTTSCAGITIEECIRRFDKAVELLSNLHPAVP